jgi:nucleoid-associated protein YgaU
LRRLLFIGILGLVVIAVAIGLNFWLNDESSDVAGTAVNQPKVPALPSQSARGSGIPVPAPPPVAAYRAGEPKSTATAPSASPAPETLENAKPEFDVVRINPEGDTVIAGRAAPGAKVQIYDGGALIGTVTADERGEWVYLPSKPLPPGKRELGLSATNPNGAEQESDAVVVLAVPARTESARKEVASQDETKVPLAVLVQRDGSRPSRVLQKPTEKGGVRKGNLSIEVVDYDDAGNISIGGKGKPGDDVQVYLNNTLVGRATASPEGEWQIAPGEAVSPGLYKLRADSISAGRVTARVEIPFSRAERIQTMVGESLVIVQPGNSLWRIARRTTGSGMNYTMIYNANKAQILDPDMIFPGQVFALPRTN